MTNDFHNILYTPLDCPPRPDVPLDALKEWLRASVGNNQYKDFLSTIGNIADRKVLNYPWDATVAYFNMTGNGPHWINNFDKEFPELAKYMYEAFGLPLKNLGLIVILPTKEEHTGHGFWHTDPDWYGMRLYLQFDNLEKNRLFLKKTKEPRTKRAGWTHADLQDEIHECKITSSKQCFYLNNVRAVHATYTGAPGSNRIAALIIPKSGHEEKVIPLISDLVVRSAEKFKDVAILY